MRKKFDYWGVPFSELFPNYHADLVKIAGYELNYQENLETYENEYWLTKLEN